MELFRSTVVKRELVANAEAVLAMGGAAKSLLSAAAARSYTFLGWAC